MADTAPRATTRPSGVIPVELTGRKVDEVRILGKTKPLGSEQISTISHVVRSREGEPFEPTTVEGDYQRIYELKKYANVEARVEPTRTGVVVIFEVTEQPVIKEIRYKGNDELDTEDIQAVVNLKVGEAIDSFRLGLAKEAIERVYQSHNLPYVHVDVDQEELNKSGILIFNVVEGPKVRVRKVQFLGNKTFSGGKLGDQIKTSSWFPIFRGGVFDADQLEQDVASLREWYEHHGFFDVRVGRRVVVAPNQKEVMIEFVIDEGQRYVVDRVTFRGLGAITEAQLRPNLKMIEGRFYDNDTIKRDTKEIVKVYSPLGYIYVPADPNPDLDYLKIRDERIFRREAGKVELIYNISEGKPFKLGRVLLKGNQKTQDKVVERELRVAPGQLYNSAELLKAQDRLKALGYYRGVTITPIPPVGAAPDSDIDVRDLLVEVVEGDTARFAIGAGVSSNSGLLGQIVYEQKNFDITNLPGNSKELFSSKAFTGAGQTFRISIEPGTQLTRARIDFVEPYIFDQPYSFGNSIYLVQRARPDWNENRIGDRVWLGHRFSDTWSARVFLRAEEVDVTNIHNPEFRAPEVIVAEGTHPITSAGLEVRRDTTNSVIMPSQGTITSATWEHAGAMGGEYSFDRITGQFIIFTTLFEDLQDRKTILSWRTNAGYISGEAPFFEEFYAGGTGSIRGFRYRGISPRSGIENDPIGGTFMFESSVELGFPLVTDVLRGVVFTDFGDVEDEFKLGTLRASVGFGFRLTLPFFSQFPLALDFAIPVSKDHLDDTRIFSFSLGTVQ